MKALNEKRKAHEIYYSQNQIHWWFHIQVDVLGGQRIRGVTVTKSVLYP